jgi:hypothetical protein
MADVGAAGEEAGVAGDELGVPWVGFSAAGVGFGGVVAEIVGGGGGRPVPSLVTKLEEHAPMSSSVRAAFPRDFCLLHR